MQLQIISQTFVNAISLSLIYILFALGLTLAAGVFDIWNFAHGEFVMVAAFITYLVIGLWRLPYPLAFIAAMAVVSLLGIILEKSLFYPMRNRPINLYPGLATFGVTGMLQVAALLLFGGNAKGTPPIIGGQAHIGSIVFPLERLPVIIGALLMISLLFLFIQRTKLGLAIRAVQQDQDASALQGMNISRIRLTVWVVSSCLAATAGVLLAPISFIDPFIGSGMLLKGFAVVIVGGLGSIPGALVAGFGLGFVDTFGMTYLGTYSYMFAFLFIMVTILIRPQGLMGRR